VELLFAHGGPESLSPEAEYELRHEDYVMEMPQSRERIRGRAAMRAMQESFFEPADDHAASGCRRWSGLGHRSEQRLRRRGVARRGHLRTRRRRRIVRDTRYYTQASEAPAWRAEWAEPI
jgi:hypothetical protein